MITAQSIKSPGGWRDTMLVLEGDEAYRWPEAHEHPGVLFRHILFMHTGHDWPIEERIYKTMAIFDELYAKRVDAWPAYRPLEGQLANVQITRNANPWSQHEPDFMVLGWWACPMVGIFMRQPWVLVPWQEGQ